MVICRYLDAEMREAIGALQEDGSVRPLIGVRSVTEGLRLALAGAAGPLLGDPLAAAGLRPPIDRHEVWGAGVTYERSKGARMEEAAPFGGADVYDRVYSAPRPELFFKATPSRVSEPGGEVVVRGDSEWSVPEPELALWLDPALKLLGIGLGNDVSARDIEAENPLYLPQAKVHERCCALGPGVLATADFDSVAAETIRMRIEREGAELFAGEISVSALRRRPEELIGYLGRDNRFPDGVVLLTGTGIVPPDEVSLAAGDEISISSQALGTLTNRVRKGARS